MKLHQGVHGPLWGLPDWMVPDLGTVHALFPIEFADEWTGAKGPQRRREWLRPVFLDNHEAACECGELGILPVGIGVALVLGMQYSFAWTAHPLFAGGAVVGSIAGNHSGSTASLTLERVLTMDLQEFREAPGVAFPILAGCQLQCAHEDCSAEKPDRALRFSVPAGSYRIMVGSGNVSGHDFKVYGLKRISEAWRPEN